MLDEKPDQPPGRDAASQPRVDSNPEPARPPGEAGGVLTRWRAAIVPQGERYSYDKPLWRRIRVGFLLCSMAPGGNGPLIFIIRRVRSPSW